MPTAGPGRRLPVAATGPGQLGRRLVPETVRADPATTSVVPDRAAGRADDDAVPAIVPHPPHGDAVSTRRPVSGSARGYA